ncbi:hypothetical protein G6F68_011153 [Rhizopus microsporus]|nr:hypothetical protein G6F68_011153 [Rhizopus microsporus]
MIPAIGEALLHIRYLQRDLARSLQASHQNWETICNLSYTSLEELHWWETFVTQKNGLPIQTITVSAPQTVIHVDASDSGWGISSPLVTASGFWRPEEKLQSINVRELKTILFALQQHASKCENSTIKIYSDNRTALKYTTKSGGTTSVFLQELAVQIQELCNYHSIKVIYQHIPGVLNTQADKLSRVKQPFYESAIPKQMFNTIQQQWGRLKIDAFAARHNYQLPIYWTLTSDPAAAAVDAMKQHWLKKGMYAYPPWKMIPQVLKLIKQQRLTRVVLVTPLWPSQFWFPMILNMKHLNPPIIWKVNKKWSLAAWLLSTTKGYKMV